MSVAPMSGGRPSLKTMLPGLLISIVIDAGLPYLIYTLLSSHTTQFWALVASSVPPLINNIVSIVRTRKLDAFGAIILLGIVVSVVAIFLGGDPRLLLVRESFVTVALSIACFVSLLLPRPLMFYFSRHFVAGQNAEAMARFDALWQYDIFRTMCLRMTIIWGAAFIIEFILKVILVYSLPLSLAVGVTPIIINVLIVLLVLWSMWYGSQVRRKGMAAARAH